MRVKEDIRHAMACRYIKYKPAQLICVPMGKFL